ncbi:MAG: HlyC/CorC family transporter [Phaeodactylibacter sp.]|nr:HlyC/CorC family transporter [Phaeodactylibacter sp.]MCB9266635.1 HlyC/CorC family transporter [Lewinellaceae bacterium]MCB9290309.1 HlyC/CorC family transporter [Lewinellaceae bacterium]
MLIALIIFFLMLSALFSGTEIAYISANKLRVELKKKKGAKRGQVLAGFYESPASFLGTMLVGNNIALVVFTYLLTQLVEPYLLRVSFFQAPLILLLIETILATVIVLLFGEFLPKTLFRLYADDILYFLAYPLKVIRLLLLIPSWLMTRLSNLLLRVLRTPIEEVDNAFTRLDLENFINDTQTDSEEDIDRELFGKALNLRDVRVRECMVPRPEIENIDLSASVEDLEQLFRETKLSRIIVTKDDIDNVLGYVHHQQLLKQPKSISKLILDLPFVPEAMRVTDLLNEFIRDRINIAIVVDEYGGVSGLITLEDILEEIFGEIEDEHDQEEYVESVIHEGKEYIFSGRLEIDYLNEKYNLGLPEGEYHTLSGYLVMTHEAIPERGAVLELNGYRFILELVSETKIETVRVIKLEEENI